MIVIYPERIVSTSNLREHWSKRAKRAKAQRKLAWGCLVEALHHCKNPELPCAVTLIRIAPRQLDGHDNLSAGFKATVDGVADFLDIKDNDSRVTWRYEQRKGKPKQYAVQIEIKEV